MKCLVTGGAGFVAGYLKRELEGRGHEVETSDVADCDLTDPSAVGRLVAAVRPEAVFHLGGIAFVPTADKTLIERVNVGGTVNLAEAFAATVPKARFFFVSTAQVLNEPLSAYAASKLKAEKAVAEIAAATGLGYQIVRPSNHTGPGQSEKFAVPGFLQQALAIKAGRCRSFKVGNLDSTRTFSDVRDVVRAYAEIFERGAIGATYYVDSGARYALGEVLALVARAVGVEGAPVEVEPTRWRPTDHSAAVDCAALRALGWAPKYTLAETLADMSKAILDRRFAVSH